MKVVFFAGTAVAGLKSIGYKSAESFGGGWSEALFDKLKKCEYVEAHYVFLSNIVKKISSTYFDGAYYHIIPDFSRSELKLSNKTIALMSETIGKIDPDIVHIWGTERQKTLEMIRIVGKEKSIVSITGIISKCGYHYLGNINKEKIIIPTINDLLRGRDIFLQKRFFYKCGILETQTLKEAKYVFGRTTWDLACIKQINKNIEYMHLNEALRPVFYSGQWKYEKCKKYSIFVSQGSYPLKGLHKLFEALPLILKEYPDAHVYVTGPNIVKDDTMIDRIKRTTYGRYLRNLIKKLDIKDNVTFLGLKNDREMYDQYLSANVFVVPSLIENSPNSLGEAMMLGVPCVASYVGGIPDMIRDKEEGFLYPFDEEYMLAYYICKIFGDVDLANSFSKKASQHARETHNMSTILSAMLENYRKIIDRNKTNR